jgi:hypothetical protein
MHLITVMDYQDPQGIAMGKAWLYFAKRFNPSARITVFHGDHISEFTAFSRLFSDVELVRLRQEDLLTHRQMRGWVVPSQDLTISLWRHVGKSREFSKVICAEADAWILAPLDEWWNAADDQPFIAVHEYTLSGRLHFNFGTYSYNSMDGFITYEKLIRQYREDGDWILYPLGDQGLLNRYFHATGYDWRHPRIGYAYNTWALKSATLRADDEDIVVQSGDAPAPSGPQDQWITAWGGWGQHVRAKILHAFWRKFWALPECDSLWRYALAKVRALES